ncbi:restriction endonuclease subunit S [Kitasatospora sp. NBC_01287]|uniref:restriction endonuclease subunit S n=1 Tax=Kitasatospora sp. NBC_01287 TaxID=2903573 RepID=UPI0022535673|nr:restriction endonuclease subunit S [Kitasatospora sp. NBC_01287]MCX4748145.1 restriction endonuclease subunit S [Kitasatospora sp. NBC_01287]
MTAERARKKSDIAWLGGVHVPAAWRRTKVKHLVSEMRAGDAITAERIEDAGSVPVYGGNGVRGFTEVPTHDGVHVLIGRQGALCGNVHLARGAFWASEHAIVSTPARGVDARWLAHLLRTMDLGQYSVTAAQPGIGVAQIAALDAYLPPLEEQGAIADYLDEQTSRIDTLIGKQNQLIDTLHERRAAVIRVAIDAASTASTPDKLARRTRVGNGSTPRREQAAFWFGGDLPWLNSAVVNSASVTGSDQYVTERARLECHLPIVRPGAVLVGLTGQGRTRGMATILEIEATVSQHVAYVQPEAAHWDSRYLLWALRSRYDDLRLMSDENGSTKGGLTCYDLANLRVARPPLHEQQAIAADLDEQTSRIDALVSKAKEHIVLAKERRAALITAAVTGQLDVRAVGRAATSGA